MHLNLPSIHESSSMDLTDLRKMVNARNNPWPPPYEYMNINPPLKPIRFEADPGHRMSERDFLQHVLYRIELAEHVLKSDVLRASNDAVAIRLDLKLYDLLRVAL